MLMPSLGTIGPAVWPSIKDKQTNRQTDRKTQAACYIDVAINLHQIFAIKVKKKFSTVSNLTLKLLFASA